MPSLKLQTLQVGLEVVVHRLYYDCMDQTDSVSNDVVNPPIVPSPSAWHHLDLCMRFDA